MCKINPIKYLRHYFYKAKNFLMWGAVGWSDAGWDFNYTFPKILAVKLRQTLKENDWDGYGVPNFFGEANAKFEDDRNWLNAEKWARPYCSLALRLVERFIEDDDRKREWGIALEIIKTRGGYWWS